MAVVSPEAHVRAALLLVVARLSLLRLALLMLAELPLAIPPPPRLARAAELLLLRPVVAVLVLAIMIAAAAAPMLVLVLGLPVLLLDLSLQQPLLEPPLLLPCRIILLFFRPELGLFPGTAAAGIGIIGSGGFGGIITTCDGRGGAIVCACCVGRRRWLCCAFGGVGGGTCPGIVATAALRLLGRFRRLLLAAVLITAPALLITAPALLPGPLLERARPLRHLDLDHHRILRGERHGLLGRADWRTCACAGFGVGGGAGRPLGGQPARLPARAETAAGAGSTATTAGLACRWGSAVVVVVLSLRHWGYRSRLCSFNLRK